MTEPTPEPDPAGVPTLEQVAIALGKPPEKVTTAFHAEVADQASRCRVEPYNAALGSALIRRVRRSINMDNLPLGVEMGEAGGVRIGSTDPEVRRLEAPYRKAPLG